MAIVFIDLILQYIVIFPKALQASCSKSNNVAKSKKAAGITGNLPAKTGQPFRTPSAKTPTTASCDRHSTEGQVLCPNLIGKRIGIAKRHPKHR